MITHIEDMAQVARASGLNIGKSIPYTHLELIKQKNHGWLAICPDVERPESQYPINQYGEVIKKLLKDRKIKKQKTIDAKNQLFPLNNLALFGQ
jgi:hypothetical protein